MPSTPRLLPWCLPPSTTTTHYRTKRRRGVQDKKVKLKSPNFCVSPLRLSVRNIPPSWDEKQLKALFVGAVKERATKEKPQVKQVRRGCWQQSSARV